MAGARWFEVEWSCMRDNGRPVEHYRVVDGEDEVGTSGVGKGLAGRRWIVAGQRSRGPARLELAMRVMTVTGSVATSAPKSR